MAAELTVLNPEGFPPKVTARGMAPSLDEVNGKRLFLVDVGFENSDAFVAELQAVLAERAPGVRTTVVRWRDEYRPDPELSERLQREADAAVLAVGT